MARKIRVQYEGAIYHLMSRGDRKEPIFHNDADRYLFLHTLGKACAKTAWQVHAYCLMRNHFHLVIETPRANLVDGMKWMLGTFTARFNRDHQLCGHLFAGRYKLLIVDGSGNGYLRSVCEYVHLNPVRASLIAAEGKLRDYPWSSYPEYLKRPNQRVQWLRTDRVFGDMHIPGDTPAGRKEFEAQMELRRKTDEPEDWAKIRRGWCFGDNEFRQELLQQMEKSIGAQHYGLERQESELSKAERVVTEELKKTGLAASALGGLKKGDAKKLKIARRLRQETTMTLQWIADRLHMGSKTYLGNLLYAQNPPSKSPRV